MRGLIAFMAFAATVPLANWMIGNVGQCIPDGPCLIPVGFGLMAPSGVLIIGAALVLRDAVHTLLGWKAAALAILVGAALSWTFAAPGLIVASVAAFVIGEALDLVVFAKLRRQSVVLAVWASGVIGAAADSAAFLWLAFGSLDYVAGQVLGKIYATVAVAVFLYGRPRCWFGHDWHRHVTDYDNCTRCGIHNAPESGDR